MTEKPNFSSNHDNPECVLGDLDDETPTSSSEESINEPKIELVSEDTVTQPRCATDDENLRKFEKNAINKIMAIKSEVEKIKGDILLTEKEALERDFKKYEEVLILKTLSLDNIQTKGLDNVKETRKDAILFVQDCLKLLDLKIK